MPWPFIWDLDCSRTLAALPPTLRRRTRPCTRSPQMRDPAFIIFKIRCETGFATCQYHYRQKPRLTRYFSPFSLDCSWDSIVSVACAHEISWYPWTSPPDCSGDFPWASPYRGLTRTLRRLTQKKFPRFPRLFRVLPRFGCSRLHFATASFNFDLYSRQ